LWPASLPNRQGREINERAALRGGPFAVAEEIFVVLTVAVFLSPLINAAPVLAQRALDAQSINNRLINADRDRRKQQPLNAIRTCDEVIRTAPNTVKAYLIKAQCFLDLRQKAMAMSLIQQALKIDPRSAEAHLELGRWYRHERKDDQAMAQFEQAVKLDSNLGIAYHAIAALAEQTGQKEKALAAYNSMVKLEPQTQTNYVLRGDFLRRRAGHLVVVRTHSS